MFSSCDNINNASQAASEKPANTSTSSYEIPEENLDLNNKKYLDGGTYACIYKVI